MVRVFWQRPKMWNMPSSKEVRRGQQRKRREAPLEAPTNEAPKTLKPRSNGDDYNPDEMLDGRKRYLGPFTDGRVLDRLSVPDTVIPSVLFEGKKSAIPGRIFIKNMKALNENTKWTGRFNRESFERLRGI